MQHDDRNPVNDMQHDREREHEHHDEQGEATGGPERAGEVGPAERPEPEAAAPRRPRGPHAPTVLLGLLCLLVAGLVIGYQVTDVSADWSLVGPGTIVGAGLVLVVLGLIGLTRRER